MDGQHWTYQLDSICNHAEGLSSSVQGSILALPSNKAKATNNILIWKSNKKSRSYKNKLFKIYPDKFLFGKETDCKITQKDSQAEIQVV